MYLRLPLNMAVLHSAFDILSKYPCLTLVDIAHSCIPPFQEARVLKIKEFIILYTLIEEVGNGNLETFRN